MPNWNIPVKTFLEQRKSAPEIQPAQPFTACIPDGYASPVSLGRNIRVLRRAANLTQEDFGDRLGVKQDAVSKWEAGKTQPDADALPTMALVLGARLDALLQGINAAYDAADQSRHVPDQRSGSQEVPGVPASEQRHRLLAQNAKLRGHIEVLEARLRDVRNGARELAKLASGRIKSAAATGTRS